MIRMEFRSAEVELGIRFEVCVLGCSLVYGMALRRTGSSFDLVMG